MAEDHLTGSDDQNHGDGDIGAVHLSRHPAGGITDLGQADLVQYRVEEAGHVATEFRHAGHRAGRSAGELLDHFAVELGRAPIRRDLDHRGTTRLRRHSRDYGGQKDLLCPVRVELGLVAHGRPSTCFTSERGR
jgi:hypothetical protein